MLIHALRRLLESSVDQGSPRYGNSFSRRMSCDIETKSGTDLKKHGLDRYIADPEFDILMIAYAFGFDDVKVWDCTDGSSMPTDLREAFDDPDCEIGAFNAHFERKCIGQAWGIVLPPWRWKCTMVRAFSQSFMGTLGEIGRHVGLPEHLQKDKVGDKLIRQFCIPQKPSKNQPHVWRDRRTDPLDWLLFVGYCRQDVVAEREIWRRIDAYEWPDVEHEYWCIDAAKNDKGIPIDRQFVENGIWMAARRRAEITADLKALTQLPNPNSPTQLTKWLTDRGYPFSDLGKTTVAKVLYEHEEGEVLQTDEVVSGLQMRQKVARTSPKKFNAILDRAHDDDFMRHAFQFAGASRTNRASGRGAQPHNFPRPPDYLEDDVFLDVVTEAVRRGDYDGLSSLVDEPLDAIVGVIRSSFRAPEGKEWVVCDLSSIESAVFGYLSREEKILDIARKGLDAYKSFAVEWFKIPYADVTKTQRKLSKPATLGCQYRLGGGQLREGKKTGLWGYGEAMGVRLTKEQAHDAVQVWRNTYTKGRQYWFDIEEAIMNTLRENVTTRVGCMKFDLKKPYLRAHLPTGRIMYYYLPRVSLVRGQWPDGTEYERPQISYMGKSQTTGRWERLFSHGGKFAENFTQALAREILYIGMRRAYNAGFDLRMDVHDELAALRMTGDERYSLARLEQLMTDPIDELPGIPLRADGWVGPYYRK